MKLQKIKDVRVGQIYQSKDDKDDIICIENINTFNKMISFDDGVIKEDYLLKSYNLIGVLGITHKIEDNKLIEISREEFEIDDIVEYEGNKMPYIIMEENTIDEELWLHSNEEDVSGIYKDSMEEEGFKKVGILGVNYEIINDKLIME